MSDLTQRRTALFNRTTTDALISSMLILDAVKEPGPEQRLTLAWIWGEIERRVPEVDAALTAAFDMASSLEEATGQYVHVDYGEVVRGALRDIGLIAR